MSRSDLVDWRYAQAVYKNKMYFDGTMIDEQSLELRLDREKNLDKLTAIRMFLRIVRCEDVPAEDFAPPEDLKAMFGPRVFDAPEDDCFWSCTCM